MSLKNIEESRTLYGIDGWSKDYFQIGKNGNLCCHPNPKSSKSIDLLEVMKEAQNKGLNSPLILRFPQIVEQQIKKLHTAFRESIWEYSYQGNHKGVFPFKVNQNSDFIDQIVRYGKQYDYGLEVGSKPELIAALGYDLSEKSLIVCNGFKDKEFLDLAFIGSQLGKNIIVVIEGPDELELYRELLPKYKLSPKIGIRFKLYSKGSGKWVRSSGDSSKFGLTTGEVLSCLEFLKKHHLKDKLSMLHFHIGSQITEIKRIKNAIKEACRVYCKIHQLGFEGVCLNLGGGIGVDYDGSKTSYDSSANYSLREYTNGVVYEIGEVCRYEGVPCPDIVTESGRIIAAYHSVVITDIREVQQATESNLIEKKDLSSINFHNSVLELKYIFENINQKNFMEYYHDSIDYYEEMFSLFNHGYISLIERGVGEQYYNSICSKALNFSAMEKQPLDEFVELKNRLVGKFLANFSMFQSIPDAWSIDQLFPIMPISLLDKKTNLKAKVVDITCDSDGCLERFVDRKSLKTVLELHMPPDDSTYYLGFFLVGAYQESLSNQHNLFGSIGEVEVLLDPESGRWHINSIWKGNSCMDILTTRKFSKEKLFEGYRKSFRKSKEANQLDSDVDSILEKLNTIMNSSPYLNK